MKKIVIFLSLSLTLTNVAIAMMDEENEYFPVSSAVTRKFEQEELIKNLEELKLEKAQLEQQIENLKKELTCFMSEKKALVAIRRICKRQQQDEAATLLAQAISGLHTKENEHH